MNSNAWKAVKDKAGILLALIIVSTLLSFLSDKFFTMNNMITILRTVSINGILCFGMTMVIISTGIDLSIGASMSLCGCVTALLIVRANLPLGIAIIAGVILGAVIGVVNGLLIAQVKLPPFIVTLAMSYIIRGISYLLTEARTISVSNELFYEIGNARVFKVGGAANSGIPILILYMALVFAVLWIVLNKTKFGYRLYAVGGNETAAKYSGINTERVMLYVYVISGVLAAICGILTCARLYSGQPTIGDGAEMDAIAATILGGTSFSGGIGTLGGAFLGAALIGVMNNGLNLLGVNSFWQMIAKGGIIIVAVLVDRLKYKLRK